MLDDRHLPLAAGAPSLSALQRESQGLAPCVFRHAHALHAHVQPCVVHHHEHLGQTAVTFADQPAPRSLERQRNRWRAMQPHLVFQSGGEDGVAPAVLKHLGHEEQRQAPRAGRRVRRARKHQMNDVLRQIVLAEGDEDLLSRKPPRAVRVWLGHGAYGGEVGTRLRLGQAHRPGPVAGDHVWQIPALQLFGAERGDCLAGALGEQGAQAEGHGRGIPDLLQRHRQGQGHALSAMFRIARRCRPAGLAKGGIGLLPARRHGDAPAFHVVGAALGVSNAIERGDLRLGEAARLVQNRQHQLPVQSLEAPPAQRLSEAGGVEQGVRDALGVRMQMHVPP